MRAIGKASEAAECPPQRSLHPPCAYLSFLSLSTSAHSAPKVCEQGPGHALCGRGGRTDHLHHGRLPIPSDQVGPVIQKMVRGLGMIADWRKLCERPLITRKWASGGYGSCCHRSLLWPGGHGWTVASRMEILLKNILDLGSGGSEHRWLCPVQ